MSSLLLLPIKLLLILIDLLVRDQFAIAETGSNVARPFLLTYPSFECPQPDTHLALPLTSMYSSTTRSHGTGHDHYLRMGWCCHQALP
jgi:hypothetical protein